MEAIAIARRLAELKQIPDAQQAYTLALNEAMGKDPVVELEAASYIFFTKGNAQLSLTAFISLYNRGYFQTELMKILSESIYRPNMIQQLRQYNKNCKALKNYPYFFYQGEFPNFADLPVIFFPFSRKGFIPYDRQENRFGTYINFDDAVVRHNFFKDLEKPILATDIYSQYELEYLNDNVRESKWVARENHIYLHYTSFVDFCVFLQCLDFTSLLKSEKIVFLIGDEISQYPIDFKERFGIDYSQYEVKPLEVNEVTRLIWHTQLITHNGGDFFNEIFYGHPNLLAMDSIMLKIAKEAVADLKQTHRKLLQAGQYTHPVAAMLSKIKKPSDKDYFVLFFLMEHIKHQDAPDPAQRIVPTLFFQPHFSNMIYTVNVADLKRKYTTLESKQYEEMRNTSFVQQFKYIKTFTPMRRPTNSYAASNRFVLHHDKNFDKDGKLKIMCDLFCTRMLAQSWMIDPEDRLYHDSVLVRFEDGKLNPKATFTALAAFLDLPYTESMTYCSLPRIEKNQPSMPGNVGGFDPATVYRTYDEYASPDERAYLEFTCRFAYQYYGYDFQYYHGEPVDEVWLKEKIKGFTCVDRIMKDAWKNIAHIVEYSVVEAENPQEMDENLESFLESVPEDILDEEVYAAKMQTAYNKLRFEFGKYMLTEPHFFNRRGQPLIMMPKLELDPDLLEQPLYH